MPENDSPRRISTGGKEGESMDVREEYPSIAKAVKLICASFKGGGKLLVCGNGGSSSDSAHIVGELVKGFLKKRPADATLIEAVDGHPLQAGLPAIDLTAQGAVISAISNDLGAELIYAQQVAAYGKQGDVLLGISTSGNAENVLLAMRLAKVLGMNTIALTGRGGGRIGITADLLLEANETETYLVQEQHIRMYHAICAEVEDYFYHE